MTEYPTNIRYWSVCLMPEYEESLEKLKDFIGDRASFVAWEDSFGEEGWAVLDVKDHSVLHDLGALECVAQTPADEPFVEASRSLDAPIVRH